MKKLLGSTMVMVFVVTLSGCTNMMTLQDERTLMVDGELRTVKVVNIPSFQIEVSPRQALCDIPTTDGDKVEGECMQYRQTFQKNFNVTSAPIQGFTYVPGYRYILDVRQEAVVDEDSQMVRPVWYLNRVVSKSAEMF